MKELLQLGVLNARGAETKHHLSCQGVGVSPNMVDEQIWCLQEAHKHGLVLQVLVRYVCPRCFDVEVVVDDLTDHTPGLAIFLLESATTHCHRKHDLMKHTMSSMRRPPLTTLPRYMSGRDE